MCKEQLPSTTVKVLADALNLSPLAHPPNPSETPNDSDNERTTDEIILFHNAYRNSQARTGAPVTSEDKEEMRQYGIPLLPDRDFESDQDIPESLPDDTPQDLPDDISVDSLALWSQGWASDPQPAAGSGFTNLRDLITLPEDPPDDSSVDSTGISDWPPLWSPGFDGGLSRTNLRDLIYETNETEDAIVAGEVPLPSPLLASPGRLRDLIVDSDDEVSLTEGFEILRF